MAKPLKLLLTLLGSLLLLLVALAIALPLLFDPNDYRAQLAKAVKAETGRDLAVGDIRLAVFPWLKLELKDLTLGNAQGFGEAPMLTVKAATVGARLWPLLREKRIEASAVQFDGVAINLAVLADGRNNWQDLVPPATPEDPAQTPTLGERLKPLDIAGVSLSDVALDYRDAVSGQQVKLSQLTLNTGRLKGNAPFEISGGFTASAAAPAAEATLAFAATVALDAATGDVRLTQPSLELKAQKPGEQPLAIDLALKTQDLAWLQATQQVSASQPLNMELRQLTMGAAERPQLTLQGTLSTGLAANLAQQRHALKGLAAQLQLGGSAIPGGKPATLSLKADVLADVAAGQHQLQGLVADLRLGEGAVAGAKSAALTLKGNVLADLAAQRHRVQGLDATLQLGEGALPGGKPGTVTLKGEALADLAANRATLTGLKLAALGLQVTGREWQVAPLSAAAAVQGDVQVAPFSPRTLMAALGKPVPATADATVLQSASLSAQLNASAKRAALDNLRVKLDDTTLTGNLNVRDIATQAVSFALAADRLNADRYLPPPLPPVLGEKATPKAKADLNAVALPLASIDQLNAQGTLQVANLTLKKLKLADVRLKLDGARGAAHTQALSAKLYGGSAELNTRFAPGAKQAVKLSLSNIYAGPLLKDFLDSDKLSGKGSMTLDVTSSGATVGAVRRALNGTLQFNLVDGAVKGFNLGKVLREGQAMLTLQAPTAAAAAPQTTDFAELRGSGVIKNGVLRSDDLSAKNPLIRLEGAGEVDLVNETLNYLAKPTLVNTASGQGGKERVDLRGIVVPIRVSGAWAKPKVSIDWQAALKQQAVGELREKLGVSEETVREKREELRSKAKEELSKGLLKLFGNKPAPAPAPAPEAAPAPAPAPAAEPAPTP